MKMLLLIVLPLALASCVTTDREVSAYLDRYYTRAEVDAINAEIECRQLARNLVQIQRCGVRR